MFYDQKSCSKIKLLSNNTNFVKNEKSYMCTLLGMFLNSRGHNIWTPPNKKQNNRQKLSVQIACQSK